MRFLTNGYSGSLPTTMVGQHFQYGLVGNSRAMADVISRIELVSATRSTVLIMGETGTGKELVARAVHHRSAQRGMPFIPVNCAAIPETLLESELFGHVKGAFTDATGTKKGKFSLADGGSIFLDEIGAMSVGLQAKLLRVLQEREIEPLGAQRTEQVDVRVIAATNCDLGQLVDDGRFRDDLFYRLHVIPIVVPPLRERLEDIPMLVEHFTDKYSTRSGKSIEAVQDDVITSLQQYHWPGNVRELEHTIERAVVLTTGSTMTREVVTIEARTSGSGGRNSVFEAAPERRMGRTRNDSQGARAVACQTASRQAHGHQSPRAFVLPGQIPVHRPECGFIAIDSGIGPLRRPREACGHRTRAVGAQEH